MAEARQRDEWDRWSLGLAMFYNANRGEDAEEKGPDWFHPFARPTKRKLPKVNIRFLKSVFVDRPGGRK